MDVAVGINTVAEPTSKSQGLIMNLFVFLAILLAALIPLSVQVPGTKLRPSTVPTRHDALPRSPYPPSPAARSPKAEIMKVRSQLGVNKRNKVYGNV